MLLLRWSLALQAVSHGLIFFRRMCMSVSIHGRRPFPCDSSTFAGTTFITTCWGSSMNRGLKSYALEDLLLWTLTSCIYTSSGPTESTVCSGWSTCFGQSEAFLFEGSCSCTASTAEIVLLGIRRVIRTSISKQAVCSAMLLNLFSTIMSVSIHGRCMCDLGWSTVSGIPRCSSSVTINRRVAIYLWI